MDTDPKTRQAEALVMAYFNQFLLDHRIISQKEYYRMAEIIRIKYPVEKK